MIDEEEEGSQPLTVAAFREEIHALRGDLNKIMLRVENIYLLVCKLMGREPGSP